MFPKTFEKEHLFLAHQSKVEMQINQEKKQITNVFPQKIFADA